MASFNKFGYVVVFTFLLLLVSSCSKNENRTSYSAHSGQTNAEIDGVVVAQVNGKPIYQSELNAAALAAGLTSSDEPLSASNPLYGEMLDELIDQRLLSERAIAQGLDKTPIAKHRIETAKERILGAIVVDEHLSKTVTDEAAQKLYKAQIALRDTSEEVRASHILVETEADALKVQDRIANGEAFHQIAYEVSKDESSRLNGGDLGYFQRNSMVAAFSETVFALEDDEVSSPFETEFGWHIAKLTDRRVSAVPTFDDMRDELISFLTFDELKKLGDSLRDGAKIDIMPTIPQEQSSAETSTQDLPNGMAVEDKDPTPDD